MTITIAITITLTISKTRTITNNKMPVEHGSKHECNPSHAWQQ